MNIITEQYPQSMSLAIAANEIREKFTPAFEMFATCHLLFNSRDVVDVHVLGIL